MVQPVIRTELVVLRPWRAEDVDFVLSVASDPLIPLISEVPKDPEMDGALAFIAAQRERAETGHGWAWAITSVDGDVLGYVGALWISQPAGRASIGYWTHSANRRKGFTADAVTATADWLLTEGSVARLEAFIEPWNVGSIRIAEKAGFEKEGLMRSFAPLNGERRDAYLFARIS